MRFLWNNPDAGRHCGSRTHLADEIRRRKRSTIPPFKVIPLCNARLWHLSVGINFQIFSSILFEFFRKFDEMPGGKERIGRWVQVTSVTWPDTNHWRMLDFFFLEALRVAPDVNQGLNPFFFLYFKFFKIFSVSKISGSTSGGSAAAENRRIHFHNFLFFGFIVVMIIIFRPSSDHCGLPRRNCADAILVDSQTTWIGAKFKFQKIIF